MPDTGWPATVTVPADGCSRPDTRVSVVDLPHPVGPTTAQNSPGWIARLKSRSAVKTPPFGVRNRFVTFRSSIAGNGRSVGGDGVVVTCVLLCEFG
jgi:hypothetical protein